MNRKEFLSQTFRTATTVLLFESLLGCRDTSVEMLPETSKVIDSKVVADLNHWAVSLNEYCRDLKSESISLVDWQDKLSDLFERVELKDILGFIEFEKLTEVFPLPDLGVATKKIGFPSIKDLPKDTVFVKKLFGMKPGRAIIPHGHSNMASGHLVLSGELRLRQYDKVSAEDNSLVIRQKVDSTAASGHFSSISDERNNVHWFINGDKPAYTFDVIMVDLYGKKYDIHNLDIDSAAKQASGDLKVPILSVGKALAKYGKTDDSR